MNGALRDVRGPRHQERLLPSVGHTSSVTHVTPAKKVTFLKRGDPQFAGVRLAVHRRSFKTFGSLMDELSQRVPLSFGVRSVTTPRGLHGLSTLEQLQDGGCYLCSDKKPPQTPRGPGRLQARSPSAVQSGRVEGGQEAPGTASSRRGPAGSRRITLVKNGDARCQQTLLLSHRDTRSLPAFLSWASDLLHFPVKQLYTVSGRKVDSLQVLLQGPSVLVCAGNEPFRSPAMDSAQKIGTKAVSELTSSTKNGCWGPRARRSVIHSRSRASSRPPPSLLSARPGLSELPTALPGTWLGPSAPSPLVAADDVEKKVCMNEDGSLSVEMRVRLHLLGEDAMLWSRRAGWGSRQGQGISEVDSSCCRKKGPPWDSLESGARPSGLCEARCHRAFNERRQRRLSWEIWRNPVCSPQSERLAPQGRAGWAQARKRHGKDLHSPFSSSECPEGSDPDSCSPRTPEGSDSPCQASEAVSTSNTKWKAGEAQYPEGVWPPGWEYQHCQGVRTHGVEGALSDSSASAKSHEESGEGGSQQWGCQAQVRPKTTQGKATHGDNPCPPSLNSEDLQTEEHEQGTRCNMTKLPLGLGQPESSDAKGISLPLPACAPAQQGRRRLQSPGSTTSLPSIPGPCQAAQRGHARLCPHCRDIHCPADSPEAPPAPRPPDRGSPCARGPVPRSSSKSSSTNREALGNLRSPCPGSPDPRDLAAASEAAVTLESSSDWASGTCYPRACSVEWARDTECGVCGSAPTPAHTRGADCPGDERENTHRPSSSSVLPVLPEGVEPGAHHGCCSSQMGSWLIPGTPSGHTEACWACSGYCPTPPGEQPCMKSHPSNSSSSSSGRPRADEEGPGAREPGEETPKVGCMQYPRPKSGRAVRGAGRSLSPGAGPSIVEPQEDGGVTPSALPHASPDAVVCEWLNNIPEETVLLRYEMVDESSPAACDSPGASSKKDMGDTRQWLQEGDPDEHPELDQGVSETVDVSPKFRDGPHQGTGQGEVPKVAAKVRAREGAPGTLGAAPRELPSRVSASTQIMKALLGSKQDRPSSLPEVSGPMAQRLSRSAETLIACLARLRFFDDAFQPPADTGRFEDSPKHQELRSLTQGLWPMCDLRQAPLDSGLAELTACQALQVTKDFTPTSSSGVDVSSGSGGSGEGSVPCAMDPSLVPEQMERSLQISQRPNSRSSGHPEPRANPQQGFPKASAGTPAQEEAGSGSGGQALEQCLEQSDSNLEPPTEHATRVERGQVEETEERQRPQTEGVLEEGVPEEEEETRRDAASAVLGHPGRGEKPTESHGSPQSEPGLKALPGAAVPLREQTQARSTPDPEVPTASLDPDPLWVSRLLKKMEEAFMAHLASATAELRARWSLQDNGLLDQMVAELQQDVGQRLRDSTNKELRKIQSRAGRMARWSPREALWGQASLQTGLRRCRLQGLRNLSAFPEQNHNWESLFLSPEDRPNLTTPLGTGLGGSPEGDEFCPCKTCIKKRKVTLRSPKDTTGAASAPIKKAFDLQQILQWKRGEAAEGAPEKTETEQPQENPTLQGANRGQELGVGLSPGSQRQSSGPKLREAAGASDQEREEAEVGERGGGAHASVHRAWEEAECVEKGAAEEKGVPCVGSGCGNTPEAAGGLAGSAEASEQPQSEGRHDGQREGGPGARTEQYPKGETSGNSSLDQEERPMMALAQAGGVPQQGPGPQTSLGSCSQVSPEGLEDQSGGDLGCPEGQQAEKKVATMYPDSSASEEDGPLSGPGSQELGTGEACCRDRQVQKAARGSACNRAGDCINGFGQDDLDF